jgi:outer membrane protein TolC
MQYDQSYENLEKSQQILDLQTSNDHHSENKYNSGIIGLDQRLDNYEDLLDAQSRYLQNLSDFILAQYKVNLRKINF